MELFTDPHRAGRALVAVLHDLNHAAHYGTHLIAMRDGAAVAEGPLAEIVTAELVEDVFGLRCIVAPDPRLRRTVGIATGPRPRNDRCVSRTGQNVDQGRVRMGPLTRWVANAVPGPGFADAARS